MSANQTSNRNTYSCNTYLVQYFRNDVLSVTEAAWQRSALATNVDLYIEANLVVEAERLRRLQGEVPERDNTQRLLRNSFFVTTMYSLQVFRVYSNKFVI